MAEAAKPGAAPPAKHEPPKELESRAAVQKFMGRAKRTPVDQAEYFYSVKSTHILFFVCSVAMLVSFLWMFRQDYERPWKEYQREFQRMDFEKLVADIRELEEELKPRRDERAALDRQIAAFLDVFRKGFDPVKGRPLKAIHLDPKAAERVPRLALNKDGVDWTQVHVVVDSAREKVKLADLDRIEGEHYRKQQDFNFIKDAKGALRFKYEEASHEVEEARKKGDPRLPVFEKHFQDAARAWEKVLKDEIVLKALFDEVDRLKTFYEDFAADLEKKPVPDLWHGPDKKPLEDLRAARTAIDKEIEEKKVRFARERPSFPNTVRNAPMADFFAPTFTVKQVILPNIKDQLNFTRVEKVDRCHTCHTGIDNPLYEVTIDRSAEREVDQYVFKDDFLRRFVEHARGIRGEKALEPGSCEICTPKADRPREVPKALISHGSWDSDDAVRFTKAFMAHPRLDLYAKADSRHPIDKFGCTVCHEGDGRDTDFSRAVHLPDSPAEAKAWRRRHGTPFGEERYNWDYRELWDLPMIPSKFLHSSCRRCHTKEVELDGAEKYVAGMTLFERAGCYGCHRTDSYQILKKDLDDAAKDANHKFRRPGPPLTRIAAKVEEDWAWRWISEPRDFRPTTRMPHFFRQSNARSEVNKKKFETAEIEATVVGSMVKYLWGLSEKSPDPAPPALKGDAGRGELLVRQVGCMACHRVEEVQYGPRESRFLKEFAPTLAGVGSKFQGPNGRTWLYHWVRDPKKHFKDSGMPNLRLQEQEAADVVEYLMTLRKPEWEKKPGMPPLNMKLLDELIREQLKLKMPDFEVEMKLKEWAAKPEDKVRWFGQKMVKNYGCYSCHELKKDDQVFAKDIPVDWPKEEGIGVELSGSQPWGSKHYDRLDFGFAMDDGVNHKGVTFKHGWTGEEITAHVHESRQDWLLAKLRNPRVFDGGKMGSKPQDELLRMPHFGLSDHEAELLATFVLSFTDHHVAGLVAAAERRLKPDEAAENRGHRIVRDNNCRACHRLSLDRFQIEWERDDPETKKKVKELTWVEGRRKEITPEQVRGMLGQLGLVSDPPKPEDEKKDLRSYAWAVDRRTLAFSPAVNPESLFVYFDGLDWWYLNGAERRKILRRADAEGGDILPEIRSYKTALHRQYQANRDRLEGKIEDLEDAIKKETDAAKKKKLQEELDAAREELKRSPEPFITGDLSGAFEVRYPPMLRTQGVKTQGDWLFNFLKKPAPIRPNLFPIQPGAPAMADVNIRMPTFEFTDEEAAALVRWFAVRDHEPGVDTYPHTAFPEREESRLTARKALLEGVGKVLRDNNTGCAKCHYVSGQKPTAEVSAHAPELAGVETRLRPRWLYAWMKDPAAITPNATMPAAPSVFPPGLTPEALQDHVRGAVEFLLNYHRLNPKSERSSN